jgi:transposase
MPRHPRPIGVLSLPGAAAPASGQAAALEAALDRELVRVLGALPLLLPVLERLGLRESVNRHCHASARLTQDLDLGLVTLVLVLNRLLAPKPLVHVEGWLGGTILPELLGFAPDKCNDDRLARALDAIHPHLEAIWQDLVVAAVREFGLDLSRLCYDITSLSFCGAYEGAELVRYGYSRDHRPDRKQVELATNVTAEGGVPVDYRVLAGNVADRATPVGNLRRLRRLAATLPAPDPAASAPAFLVISDRAMLTPEALAAYEGSGFHYLGPLDPSLGAGAVRALLERVPAEELTAAPLAYRPQRAADDPDWQPYRGVLRELELAHPGTGRPLRVRALVVFSPSKARVDAQLRATQLSRLEASLADLAAKLGRRPYTTLRSVEKRVANLLRRNPARAYLEVAVAATEAGLRLSWQRRQDALAAAERYDGRYVLGTNAPHLSADQMLAQSKRRDVPEKGYARLKGPLAVRPVYLHKQERILGLVFCAMVALLVFTLLELLARRSGQQLSGEALLQQFAPLAVLVFTFKDGSALRRLTGLAPPLAALLSTLGHPPPERYLAVHP